MTNTLSYASTPRLSSRVEQLHGSVIDSSTSLLASQTHDIVRFAMGAPNAELIPEADFARLFAAPSQGRFDYGATEGEPELIREVAAQLHRQGLAADPERILITTGGMQGLDIAFKLLIDAGDTVVVEAPTYTNGIGTAQSYQARILEAPIDQDGMVVEELPRLVAEHGQTPKAIYTVPNFQNPSGTTMSLERRRELLRLAEEWDAVIIDDDPYGTLRFEGEPVPSFAELSPGNPRIIQVRTFSKVLAPGLRIGWLELDPALRQLAINAKQSMDTCTGVPMQHIVADYLAEGALDAHIARLRGVYRERKYALINALADTFGEEVTTTNPEGGFFLWLTLGGRYAQVDAEELFPIALRHGVAYIPGPAFTASGTFHNALRLCFATSSPDRIREGVSRLHRALEEAIA
ncbi:aminotransferase-like domain-containing protein [Gulosibacter chungangensis]|uniref:PLP-dependent aminotransferase family protein n=1 Tax=Gulosibacter chungangensis TaxID=979746 RepID=A0A7J5B9C6_9MICO|nr:PLP-dependent aminotransferase family protein [Gulosibacter chungangensis]KAB1642170.1 PLP-dependent aminotransferase family protein [Gulosibacter chungangensis]